MLNAGDYQAIWLTLKLAGLTAKTLQQGLALLGINTLERM